MRRVAGFAIAAAMCGCPTPPKAPTYAAIHVDRCIIDAPYTEQRTALERRLTDEAAALVEARHDSIDACWRASGFDGNYVFTFVSGGERGSVRGHDVFGDATTEDCLTAALAEPPTPAGAEAAEATCSLVLGSQGPTRITVRDQIAFDAGAPAPEPGRDHHAVVRTQPGTTVARLWEAVDSARAAGATAIDVGLVEGGLLTHVDVDTRSDAEVSSDPTSEVLWIAGDDVVALPNVNDQEVKFAAADEVTVFTVTVQMGRARVVGATRTILVPARRR